MRLCFIAFFFLPTLLFATERHQVVLLLTNPRAVSTAFEKSMIARKDLKVFHEPWVSSYMYNHGFHETVFSQLPPEEIVNTKNFDEVKELIFSYAEKQPVFVKDMIWCMIDELRGDTSLIADTHVVMTFLIRDPVKSIESFYAKAIEWNEPATVDGFISFCFRYDVIYELAKKHYEIKGEWPVIVDAEDLCREPERIMEAYCERVGIPFIPEALSWKSGMPDEWRHLANWHDKAAESNGFVSNERSDTERFLMIPETSLDHVEAIYRQQKPYYDKLLELRLKGRDV